MKMQWKKALAVAMSLVMTAGLADAALPARQAEAAKKKTYVVVLDPGHDETHTGAQFEGLIEEEITLQLAEYCKEALEDDYSNIKVYLTREDEECANGGKSISTSDCLKARAKFAKKKKATVFVSLHVNSSTGTVAKGVESYSATAFMNKKVGKTSQTFAKDIQAKLVKLGFTNRGTKFANWTVIKTANEYNIPAVLIEHGFIRNPSDRRWLSSKVKLKKMAQADADGIAEGLGLKKTEDVDDEDEDEDYDEDDYDYDDDDDYDSVKVTKKKTASTVTKEVKAAGKQTATSTVKLSSITAVGFTGLQITWQAYPNAKGYAVYRRLAEDDYDDDAFKKVATVKDLSYTDYAVKAATAYQYTVRAYGKGFKTGNTKKFLTKKTRSAAVEEFKAARGTFNVIDLSWKQKSDAGGYRIERAKVDMDDDDDDDDEDDGEYKKLTTITKSNVLAYKDKTAAAGATYRYRIRAYHKQDGMTQWGAYSSATVTIPGSSSSSSSRKASELIAGEPQTTTAQMKAYYKARGVTYPSSVYSKKGASTIDKFVKIVYEEAEDEGIRPEVVFAQICRETSFLQFGGQVKAKQCNFAGLGVTGGDTSGETFDNVRQGVRAQVQHLKAYANTESLAHSKVDPRFDFVKRGSAQYVEWLGIQENPNGSGWASEENYGYGLVDNFIKVMLAT